MAKFKSFSCPPSFVLAGKNPNFICKCNKRKLCGKQTVAPTPVDTFGSSGGIRVGPNFGYGGRLITTSLIASIRALSGLGAKHQKGSRPVKAGTAPKTPHTPRQAVPRPQRQPHKVVKTLGGLDDLAELGGALGTDIPAAITSAGTAVASIANAIKGTKPTSAPQPAPTRSTGMPSWVIPAAIAGVVILGGATVFATTRK